jgi:BirA family biotin operon repressor/biotin-[acetyl-CoA-carboxylase] ligase
MQALSISTIRAALTTRRLGQDVLYFDTVGSTNDVLREKARGGAPEGLLAVADEQTAGRGRQGRSWWAPRGSSLLFSLLLRPPLPAGAGAQCTMCLGLGAAEGIETVTGVQVALKWPNDLVLSGRKLAGMLTEFDADGDRLRWVVLGLGINVNLPLLANSEVPQEVRDIAISLSDVVGHPVERLHLLAAILAATERWYERLLEGESPHAAWAGKLDTLGRGIHVQLPDGTVLSGVAEGVDSQGALLLRDDAGVLRTIWAGDIHTLRGESS